MLNRQLFDLDDALDAYVFANSASFLAKRLRSSVLVQQLASAMYDAGELVATVEALVRMPIQDRGLEDVAFAYSCLIALYEKSETQAVALLADVPLDSMKWAAEMRPHRTVSTPQVTTSVLALPPIVAHQQQLILTEGNTSYQLNPRPQISAGTQVSSALSSIKNFKFQF